MNDLCFAAKNKKGATLITFAESVYLLFVGRTRRMTQDTASGMHHATCLRVYHQKERETRSFLHIITL